AAAANSSRIHWIVALTWRAESSPSTRKYRSQLWRTPSPWTTERMKAKWPTWSLRARAATGNRIAPLRPGRLFFFAGSFAGRAPVLGRWTSLRGRLEHAGQVATCVHDTLD